jgi:hypothetical protein
MLFMVIRHALPTDSPSLIALTALTPMQGTISLRIDRKPDFFRLLKERGEAIVLVAEDESKNIVGSFSAAKQSFFLDDDVIPVYYLGDLKVHPTHTRSLLAYKLVKEMHRQLLQAGADLLVCTAAEGNASVFPFFDGRAGIPPFRRVNTFHVYQMLPRKGNIAGLITSAKEDLQAFFQTFYRRFHFHPCMHISEDEKRLVVKNEQVILAAITLYDPSNMKQNVVMDYPFSLQLTLGLLRRLKKILPLPPLPAKGQALRLLYVRQFGFLPKAKEAFLQLLQDARAYAFQHQYHFLTVAVDERDLELRKLVAPLSRLSFRSVSLATSLSNNQALLQDVCSGIAYEDYSLV